MKATPPPLMTHEERRQLIERPFSVRTIGGSRWGGRGVASDDGLHRTYTPRIAAMDDEPSVRGDNNGE